MRKKVIEAGGGLSKINAQLLSYEPERLYALMML